MTHALICLCNYKSNYLLGSINKYFPLLYTLNDLNSEQKHIIPNIRLINPLNLLLSVYMGVMYSMSSGVRGLQNSGTGCNALNGDIYTTNGLPDASRGLS